MWSLKHASWLKMLLCCGFVLLTMQQISPPALAHTTHSSTIPTAITEFPEPHHHTFGPDNILPGYHQDLWFTFANASYLGHITTKGVITEYPANIVPGYRNAPVISLAVDHADNAWFAGDHLFNEISTPNNFIDRMAPDGTITRFHIPSGKSAEQLLLGPDGNIWFLEYSTESYPRIYTGIGSITPDGKISEWPLPIPDVGVYAWGPDGTLWMTEPTHKLLVHLSSPHSKPLATYPFPYTNNDLRLPYYTNGQLRLMPDGQLWFLFLDPDSYSQPTSGTISPKGIIHLISFTGYAANLLDTKGIRGFTVDSAGTMWFSAVNTNWIMRYYPDMSVTIYQLYPHGGCGESGVCYPEGITTGPDHNIWFAEEEGNRIGRIDLNVLP